MRPILLSVATLLFAAPVAVEASVIITEVAWMGGVSSANHEWIELHNNGSTDEVVDGWVLADGNSLLITLSGTIGAGEYAVLERTSDETAPGSAFLIYTGALVNTGATLTLRRVDGQIEDRVDGGENWQLIGGDNTSKYTAQYGGSSWRTASPTPGAAAVLGAVVEPPTITPSGTNTTPVVTKTPTVAEVAVTSGNKSRSATIPIKKSTAPLELAIGSQEVMYVNQPVTFNAVTKGVGKTVAASLEQRWNFGDLTMATGSKVTHRFTHPGTYIVVVQSRFGRHDVVARKEVVVLPVRLSLAKSEDGQVLLQNDSVYDVDVSGYGVRSGDKTLTFPPLSFVAAKQAVPLLVEGDAVVLFDSRSRVMATFGTGELGENFIAADLRHGDTRDGLERSPIDLGVRPLSLQMADAEEFVGDVGEVLFVPQVVEAAMSPDSSSVATGTPSEVTLNTAAPVGEGGRWPYGAAVLVVAGILLVVWWPRSEVVSG